MEKYSSGLRRVGIRCALLPSVVLCIAAASLPTVSHAIVNLTVPNGDFSESGNVDNKSSLLGIGGFDTEFGSGPWSVDSNGVAALLLAPSADIDQVDATIGGLVFADISLIGPSNFVSNSASIYQNDIGATFTEGWTYTLKATVTTGNLIAASLLADAGVGIGLRDAGSTIYANGSDTLVSLAVFDGNSGTITYTVTADGEMDANAIGIDLFVGNGSSLANIAVFGAISFDNVTLTAVPEPSMSALLVGLIGLSYVGLKRRSRQSV